MSDDQAHPCRELLRGWPQRCWKQDLDPCWFLESYVANDRDVTYRVRVLYSYELGAVTCLSHRDANS